MNRTVKLLLIAAIAEMTLVGIAALAWKASVMGGLDMAHLHHKFPVALLFYPAWLAACSIYLVRRLTSDRPRLSDSHRQFINTGLAVASIAMAALHGLLTYSFLSGWTPDRPAFLRLVVVITGVWMAMQGNFAAKLDPPSGDGAPRVAVWTRMQLRMGWGMALAGILLIVCGLAAPMSLILPVMLVLVVLGLAAEVAYRRVTRPGQTA
jgi:hypothetical protein